MTPVAYRYGCEVTHDSADFPLYNELRSPLVTDQCIPNTNIATFKWRYICHNGLIF